MGATGDFQRSLDLGAFFAGVSRDGLGATRAAMQATQESTADSFQHERDPAGKAWADLRPSTLKRRPPGPILRGLQADLLWGLITIGAWYVRSQRKGYAVYHLGKDGRTGREARPFVPQESDQMIAVSERVHSGLGRWLSDHMQRVGL